MPLAHSGGSDDGQIQGLGGIPDDWPELPLERILGGGSGLGSGEPASDLEERPGRATLVRLARALSPAPSWAALGWLETSIRSYAKFVDVAAKAASTDDGEASWVKREKMAIEEIEALINEMVEEEDVCLRCGQAIEPK